jgi:siroheme synthase-like protein
MTRRRFLPIGLDVRRRACTIVGGGSVGTRKAATLREAGAQVTVVAPSVTPELRKLVGAGQVHWIRAAFRPLHLDGAFLAVAATDDWVVNAAVVRAAERRGVLACDASSGTRSHLIFGALLDQPDATIAVFTDGRDPAHARDTRDRIAWLLEHEMVPK